MKKSLLTLTLASAFIIGANISTAQAHGIHHHKNHKHISQHHNNKKPVVVKKVVKPVIVKKVSKPKVVVAQKHHRPILPFVFNIRL